MNHIIAKVVSQAIDNQEVISLVESEVVGAVAVFIGTVRNHNLAKKVVRLEYEAYEPMAVKKMTEIAETAQLRWNVEKIAIYHRVGSLAIGETAVVVAVSTKHRRESFEACQYIIDTLKEVVPIWKKEIYEDGQVWLAAHP
jgi:molybdopterin synthase catalytic subunit